MVTRGVNSLTSRWGEFIEYIVAPDITNAFAERGIKLEGIYQRIRRSSNGIELEIDILGIGKEYVLLVEVKSSVSIEDIQEHIERLEKFKQVFEEYRDKKVIGAVAGIVMKENKKICI